VLYSPDMYPKVQFLLLAQALEAYHRRVTDGQYLPDNNYKVVLEKLYAAIPDNLDEEFIQGLKSRIYYGNEYTLETRLRKLLDEVLIPYKEVIDKIVVDRVQFVKKVKKTRNYLTHHSETNKRGAITNTGEMIDYVFKMKLILQLCFLVELEFPISPALELVQRNPRFNQFF